MILLLKICGGLFLGAVAFVIVLVVASLLEEMPTDYEGNGDA